MEAGAPDLRQRRALPPGFQPPLAPGETLDHLRGGFLSLPSPASPPMTPASTEPGFGPSRNPLQPPLAPGETAEHCWLAPGITPPMHHAPAGARQPWRGQGFDLTAMFGPGGAAAALQNQNQNQNSAAGVTGAKRRAVDAMAGGGPVRAAEPPLAPGESAEHCGGADGAAAAAGRTSRAAPGVEKIGGFNYVILPAFPSAGPGQGAGGPPT